MIGAISTEFEPVWTPVADHRAVLVGSVVVGGDRATGDVRVAAHVGVAHVREVWHLRTLADVGGLGLDERAPIFTLAPRRVPLRRFANGPISQSSPISESVTTEFAIVTRTPATVSIRCVSGPTTDPLPTTVRPSRIVPGSSRVSAASSTPASMYVCAGSTMVTPSRIQCSVDPLTQDRFGFGELGTVVDTECFRRIVGHRRDHPVAGTVQHLDGVGEVVLTLPRSTG